MTPPHDAVWKAHASKLEWMTATFVPTKKLFGVWERCWSQGPGHRPWIGVFTSSNVWTSVIARCHANPIGCRAFFLRIAIVLPGSIGLCWGQLLSPPCTCFCGMPMEFSCTCAPLVQQLRDKGILLTAKALGFQDHDGWTFGY